MFLIRPYYAHVVEWSCGRPMLCKKIFCSDCWVSKLALLGWGAGRTVCSTELTPLFSFGIGLWCLIGSCVWAGTGSSWTESTLRNFLSTFLAFLSTLWLFSRSRSCKSLWVNFFCSCFCFVFNSSKSDHTGPSLACILYNPHTANPTLTESRLRVC